MSGNHTVLSGDALLRALALRDLTDPSLGAHALQLLVDHVTTALAASWGARLTLHRAPPVVGVDDNYDALLYASSGAARGARYTRWVSDGALLRTQTSALIPPLLRARAPAGVVDDELLACPGIVYRRDSIDRLHVGEPHQIDLWRLARRPLTTDDLDEMLTLALTALVPNRTWRTEPRIHPYTTGGMQIDVDVDGAWIEVGECGLAHPGVLARAGIDPTHVSGLAMGLGLDRLLMVRKGIDDIRLVRASDPRIERQMRDLAPYTAVSKLPSMTRDLSIVVDEQRDVDEIGDRIRAALGDDAGIVEEVRIVSEATYTTLPVKARARLAMAPTQKNLLVRVVLRPLDKTLTDDEGNALRNRIYAAIHEGAVAEWS